MVARVFFENAEYRIQGKYGDKVVLHINYKNNKFKIEGAPTPSTRKEVRVIAKDLLERKHDKNIAELEVS